MPRCLLAIGLAAPAYSVQLSLENPSGVPEAPYLDILTGSSLTLLSGTDLLMPVTWNADPPDDGLDADPAGLTSEEAPFLAAVEMYDSGSGSNQMFMDTMEDPISLAIWRFLGSIGNYPSDPVAIPFIRQAQNAWNHLLDDPRHTPDQQAIMQSWLTNVLIFTPNLFGAPEPQGAEDHATVLAEVPDSGPILFGAGLGLIAFGRMRPPTWRALAANRQSKAAATRASSDLRGTSGLAGPYLVIRRSHERQIVSRVGGLVMVERVRDRRRAHRRAAVRLQHRGPGRRRVGPGEPQYGGR